MASDYTKYQIDEDNCMGLFYKPEKTYWMRNPTHYWDAEKLHLRLNDAFTTLPKRFNMMAIPILDRDAFRFEVQSAAARADNVDEFYTLLESRMEDRRKEQLRMMEYAFQGLSGDPKAIDVPNRSGMHWLNFMRVAHAKSFDAIINLIAGFNREHTQDEADVIDLETGLPKNANKREQDHPTTAALPPQRRGSIYDQDEDSTAQADTSSHTSRSSENAPIIPPPEIFSHHPPVYQSTVQNQKQDTTNSQRPYNRPLNPLTGQDDEAPDKRRPSKVIPLDSDVVDAQELSCSSPRARKESLSPVTAEAEEIQHNSRPTTKICLDTDAVGPQAPSPSRPRTRKRSFTPASADDGDRAEEAQPSKRPRLADTVVEADAVSSCRRPESPGTGQNRKEHLPSRHQPSGFVAQNFHPTVPPSIHQEDLFPAPPQPEPWGITDGANGGQQLSMSPEAPPMHSEAGLQSLEAESDTKIKTGKQRKGRAPTPNPRSKSSSKEQKPAQSQPSRKRASRTTIPEPASGSVRTVHQTRSSQRLLRRRGQGTASMLELNTHGRAQSVVAW